jgi:hypothetical protein
MLKSKGINDKKIPAEEIIEVIDEEVKKMNSEYLSSRNILG